MKRGFLRNETIQRVDDDAGLPFNPVASAGLLESMSQLRMMIECCFGGSIAVAKASK